MGETCVIALEHEIATAKPGGCDGDQDLVTDQGGQAGLGFDDATILGASEGCESNILGVHFLCVDC